MPQFCDVALPLPLEGAFTYRLQNGSLPVIGGRVLVPFRSERMTGIVTRLHDAAPPPKIAVKDVLQIVDERPALTPGLLKLGEWISHYYLAPLGEVFRAMLPLEAEVKRERVLRITELGREALFNSASAGSSLRSRKAPEEQAEELRVLDALAQEDEMSEAALRRALRPRREILQSLLRKKWLTREDVSDLREAGRFELIAILSGEKSEARHSKQQEEIVAALSAHNGRLCLAELRDRGFSMPALKTLIKHGTVKLERHQVDLSRPTLQAKSTKYRDLTPAQKQALEKLRSSMSGGKFRVALLHGVTGSGKTAVYLAAMQAALAAGKSAILLVPEIGLTPAAAVELHELFGANVAILHSALSPDERAQEWRRIRNGHATIVVGTRSAIFAPVENLALIVVDEEHDASYKQEETPRYNGRNAAVMRGKLENALVVLSSATPSLESYHNAEQKKYELIELRERVAQRPLPEVEILDMRQEFEQTGEQHLFARRLADEIRERLARKEQAIILLNRRGYSPVILCRACGETIECRNCAIALTHHKRAGALICHYSGARERVPGVCPKCASEHLFFLGAGSEKLEERLSAEFPQARIGRLDRDTVRRRQDFERILAAFDAGELDLLVGTQMIAKGHDVHGVTLVGVVGADFALGFPDFRAAERTFQLLTQVAGRAGRGAIPGKVILQTYFPEHYAIQFAAKHDYAGFCEKELRFRKWMNYPPFTAVATVLVRGPKLEHVLRHSGVIGAWFEKNKAKGMRVMGPAAAPLHRLKQDYRYHFILKSESREQLNKTLRAMLVHCDEKKISRTSVIVDVDALSLL
jgi:primosomal protein N' (replication factor Y)